MKQTKNHYNLPVIISSKVLQENRYENYEQLFSLVQAGYDIYRNIGSGLDANVYKECFAIELSKSGIDFNIHEKFDLHYQREKLHSKYIPDYFCYHEIAVQIISTEYISKREIVKMKNSLNMCGIKTGLIINFGHEPKLEYEKIFA